MRNAGNLLCILGHRFRQNLLPIVGPHKEISATSAHEIGCQKYSSAQSEMYDDREKILKAILRI
jgi:hypothetical protein